MGGLQYAPLRRDGSYCWSRSSSSRSAFRTSGDRALCSSLYSRCSLVWLAVANVSIEASCEITTKAFRLLAPWCAVVAEDTQVGDARGRLIGIVEARALRGCSC